MLGIKTAHIKLTPKSFFLAGMFVAGGHTSRYDVRSQYQ